MVKVFAEDSIPPSNRIQDDYLRCWKRSSDDYDDLLKALNDFNPEVVHFQYEPSLFMYTDKMVELLNALRDKKIKSIGTIHAVIPKDCGHDFMDHILKKFDLLLAHTPETKDVIDDRVDLTVPVVVIPHGIVIDKIYPDKDRARDILKLPTDKFIIMSFGFISQNKNHKVILKALKSLTKYGYDDIVYLIAGHPVVVNDNNVNEKYFKELKDEIKNLELEDRVIIHKRFVPVGSVKRYMCAADLAIAYMDQSFIFSTSGAASLFATYEIPNITSDVPFYSFLSREESFKVSNQRGLELAIIALKDRYKQLQIKYKIKLAMLRDKNSWPNTAKKHEFVYNKLLEEGPNGF